MSTPIPPPLPPFLDTDPTQLPRKTEITNDQLETKNACNRILREYSEPVLYSWNKKITSIMQEGPSCGLAAMCMASQLVSNKTNNILTLGEVFNHAKARQFTCSGEMFSAINMGLLIQEMLGCSTELLDDGLENNREKIIRHVSSGRSALVPYDADKNHEPCCQNGHKAHWAVLTGAVFVLSSSSQRTSSFIPDSSCQTLYHINSTDESSLNFLPLEKQSSLLKNLTDLYVYAKQGKSQRLVAWKYTALAKSNANLTEISPIRGENLERYRIPEEGIIGGLRNRIILLESVADNSE